jgi:hypothetical protein
MTPAKLVMTPAKQPTPARVSRTSTTALALFGTIFLALAAVGGASLTASGSSALQGIVQGMGFGRTSGIEAEQHRQAAAIAELKRFVHIVSADVGAIGTRLTHANHQDMAVNDRFALVDAEIAAVMAEVRSLRAGRSEPGTEPWRAPVDQLDVALIATHGALGDLRTSLDEHDQTYRKDIGAITGRLDRLEQMVTRDLTASIRPAARKKTVRRKGPGTHVTKLRREASVVGRDAGAATILPAAEFQIPPMGRAYGAPY